MENLENRLGKRHRQLLLAAIAVALLSLSSAEAADEFSEADFFAPEECANCNLFWHGSDGYYSSRLPRWYAGADVMVLRRDMDKEVTFATFSGTSDIALGTSSFKDDYDTGLRVFAGYALNDWYRIEGLYYGSYAFTGDMAIRDTGNAFDYPFGGTGNYARIQFKSNLNNAELNLRSRLSVYPDPLQVSLLFGGRYINLAERFSYNSDGTIQNIGVRTHNDLFGLQIGMMAQWQCHPRSWLDYEVKAAVYSDRASQSTTIESGTMTAAEDVTAFSLDMSLIFNYQLTRAISLRFGYNAIWIGGVALAAQNVQSDVDLLTHGPAKLNHSGLVVYHGPSFGVVIAW